MPMKITEALLAEHTVFHTLFDTVERLTPGFKTLGEAHAGAEILKAALESFFIVVD